MSNEGNDKVQFAVRYQLPKNAVEKHDWKTVNTIQFLLFSIWSLVFLLTNYIYTICLLIV